MLSSSLCGGPLLFIYSQVSMPQGRGVRDAIEVHADGVPD